uniref:Reverse transcriptase zinc-binding domain-containing protein n=1 Tax=Chenopodium quinoa TaxID=63459 RepID=A0A803MZF7_CHEQI
MNRLWIRVYDLPLGLLDPEWAVKTLDLVGLVETLDYDGDGLLEEPEFRGQVMVDLSKPLIPGCFVPGNSLLFGFILGAFTLEWKPLRLKGWRCIMIHFVGLFILIWWKEPPDNESSGGDNPDSDSDNEPNNPDSDSDSSRPGDNPNNLPNGYVHEAEHYDDNDDNIDPDFIPINGVYQNWYMTQTLAAAAIFPLSGDTASRQSSDSFTTCETDPTTPDSYHNLLSTKKTELLGLRKHGLLRLMWSNEAPLEDSFLSESSISSSEVPSNFSSDISVASEFYVPIDTEATPQSILPAHSTDMGLHMKRSRQGPFTRCRSYDQLPYFGYPGMINATRKRKVTDCWVSSTLKFQILDVLASSFGNGTCLNATTISASVSPATSVLFGLAAGPSQLPSLLSCSSPSFVKGLDALGTSGGLVVFAYGSEDISCVFCSSNVILCNGRRYSGRDSYGLHGLLHADALLSTGCIWKVENGKSILAGSSNWVNDTTPGFHSGIPLAAAMDWTVNFFIHPQTLTWDIDKVKQCFQAEDASTILAMENPALKKDDFQFWGRTTSGNYTLQPKWKLFLWKLFHNGLAIKSELHRRGIPIQEVSCDQCSTQLEDFNHLFRDCTIARTAWRGGALGIRLELHGHLSLSDWIQDYIRLFISQDGIFSPINSTFVDFAKAQFGSFPKSTDVVVQLYDTRFDAHLKIKRRDEKLIQCFIKNEIVAVIIDYYDIQIDEGAIVSYEHGNPIVFDVTLQLSADF